MERGGPVRIIVDGVPREAFDGESVAAAMMSSGEKELRQHESGEPRGYFCGMGTCFDCVMTVDGVPNTRTCVTWVRDGLTVERQRGAALASDGPGDAPH